jgi:hypothetical protein
VGKSPTRDPVLTYGAPSPSYVYASGMNHNLRVRGECLYGAHGVMGFRAVVAWRVTQDDDTQDLMCQRCMIEVLAAVGSGRPVTVVKLGAAQPQHRCKPASLWQFIIGTPGLHHGPEDCPDGGCQ